MMKNITLIEHFRIIEEKGNMKGLVYIMKTWNLNIYDIAEGCRAKVQTVEDWINDIQPMPEYHLELLKVRFSMPVDYFQRELSIREKLEVKGIFIKRKMKSLEKYRYFIDDEEGNEVYEFLPVDNSELQLLDMEMSKAKATKSVNKLARKVKRASITKDNLIDTIEGFTSLVSNQDTDFDVVKPVIDALKVHYGLEPKRFGRFRGSDVFFKVLYALKSENIELN